MQDERTPADAYAAEFIAAVKAKNNAQDTRPMEVFLQHLLLSARSPAQLALLILQVVDTLSADKDNGPYYSAVFKLSIERAINGNIWEGVEPRKIGHGDPLPPDATVEETMAAWSEGIKDLGDVIMGRHGDRRLPRGDANHPCGMDVFEAAIVGLDEYRAELEQWKHALTESERSWAADSAYAYIESVLAPVPSRDEIKGMTPEQLMEKYRPEGDTNEEREEDKAYMLLEFSCALKTIRFMEDWEKRAFFGIDMGVAPDKSVLVVREQGTGEVSCIPIVRADVGDSASLKAALDGLARAHDTMFCFGCQTTKSAAEFSEQREMEQSGCAPRAPHCNACLAKEKR